MTTTSFIINLSVSLAATCNLQGPKWNMYEEILKNWRKKETKYQVTAKEHAVDQPSHLLIHSTHFTQSFSQPAIQPSSQSVIHSSLQLTHALSFNCQDLISLCCQKIIMPINLAAKLPGVSKSPPPASQLGLYFGGLDCWAKNLGNQQRPNTTNYEGGQQYVYKRLFWHVVVSRLLAGREISNLAQIMVSHCWSTNTRDWRYRTILYP